MHGDVTCPTCGWPVTVPRAAAAWTGKCFKCRAPIHVPAGAAIAGSAIGSVQFMGFQFPDLCAKCGVPHPDAIWCIRSYEKYGTWETTYSIGVPVCARCKTRLIWLSVISWVGGGLVGVLVGLIPTGWSFPAGFSEWAFLIFGGLVGLVLGHLLIGWCLGLFFATIVGACWTLHFSNKNYQIEFNSLNRQHRAMEDLERRLREDPIIRWILDDKNRSGPAEAAIAFFLRGEACPDPSWRRSSTWKQVQAVYQRLQGGK
jgi:hypothetical protein